MLWVIKKKKEAFLIIFLRWKFTSTFDPITPNLNKNGMLQ